MNLNRALLLVIGQFTLFGLLVIAFAALPMMSAAWLQVIGGAGMVAGALVLWGSIQQHTRTNAASPNVMPIPRDDAQLVVSGIYAYVRHPIYSSVLLVAFGIALLHGHIVLFAIAAALYALLDAKSRYEEHFLIDKYPDYADYMTMTGRFIPPLRR